MMRLRSLTKMGMLLAAMAALLAAPAGAVTTHPCTPAQPTAESYTWNFHQEATNLLSSIRDDAAKIRDLSDQVNNYTKEPDLIDWRLHADKLRQIKSNINDIGAKVCRLETIRSAVLPWQQRVIDRIAHTDRLMANNTEDAINFLNGHHEGLWLAPYPKYAKNLYSESDSIASYVGNSVEMAKLRQEQMRLHKKLNMHRNS